MGLESQGPSIGAIQSSMMAGVGANPGAGGPLSGMINKGAAGYSPSGKGFGSNPLPGLFGSIANGGAFGLKPGQQGLLLKIAASIREDMAKINSAGQPQAMPVREASAGEIYGHGLGGMGRGGSAFIE